MIGAGTYRGQPLVALIAIMAGWTGMRAMMWDAGTLTPAAPLAIARPAEPRGGVEAVAGGRPTAVRKAPVGAMVPGLAAVETWPGTSRRRYSRPKLLSLARAEPAYPLFLFAEGMDYSLHPQAAPRQRLRAAAPFHPAGHEPQGGGRWSADGWLLVRRGGEAGLTGGSSPSTYGASQAGAVLRYRLAPGSGHRPTAYLRATSALNGSHDREAALGVSARPFTGVPVIAAVELRATTNPQSTSLRPAGMVVTELPTIELPLGMRAEAYGQAGYVGGSSATAFADGQVKLDRKLVRIAGMELRAGAGVWGGAQKGASRLDFGPTASLAVPLGQSGSARLALDWRFRAKGNAAPSSGPALTLSAGF